jgi:hypothetical protein
VIADQLHDAVGFEWFEDPDHLARFARWLTTRPGPEPGAVEIPTVTVEVEEVVLRGQDWLERRWRRGGNALKHMAIARRAEGLTPSEFSDRWRARAGTVRAPGAAAAVAIPGEARGQAYVQNHPRPRTGGEWAYDAVNEVYFDDLEGLRRRIAWFEDTLSGGTEDDLVRENWFLAVDEVDLPLH